MNLDRRSVVKALAAAGLAVVGVPIAQASTQETAMVAGGTAVGRLKVTSLVSGTELDAPFLSGVQERVRHQVGDVALTGYHLQGLEAGPFTHLDALLNDGTPNRLIGLVDDATATLVLDLVRSAGGRVMHSAHHRVGTGQSAAHWAQTLGRILVTADTAPPVQRTAAAPQVHAYVSFSCVI
ncbi:hypothetical protein F2Q65_18905 [Thiohalocapsa marina]|uniref:Twin-arginine translocation signal domain-containing protein n=1 Tax=Thiohalocapsa marina TaxID=424902 RepID=A0A5M8FGM3_9GAMM|nr:hypothetical protein [Thiohalocapsa marina]KAA6181775.1 hypothetical protein F2Q65_18905 [Thiohalocapsa marina]